MCQIGTPYPAKRLHAGLSEELLSRVETTVVLEGVTCHGVVDDTRLSTKTSVPVEV